MQSARIPAAAWALRIPKVRRLRAAGGGKAARTARNGLREVEIRVKGPGSGRESAISAIQQAGLRIASIEDVTPIPHNGCRPRKRRARIKREMNPKPINLRNRQNMARYLEPTCRQCRREGMKLMLKGARCETAKCAIERRERSMAPGQHGLRAADTAITAFVFAKSKRLNVITA